MRKSLNTQETEAVESVNHSCHCFVVCLQSARMNVRGNSLFLYVTTIAALLLFAQVLAATCSGPVTSKLQAPARIGLMHH